ncbi:MAG: S41 family peptidase [bacterium]
MINQKKEILKRIGTGALVVLVVGAVFASGFISGQMGTAEASKIPGVVNTDKSKPKEVSADFELFWKAWSTLNDKYVATHNSTTSPAPTNQDRVYGAIKGMTAALGDPYTVFFTPSESSIFESEIDGNFEGVGMELGIKNDILTVISALKSTPAEKAGIMSGDKILKIDSTLTTGGLSVEQAVKLIRGPKGTQVAFTLLRGDATSTIEIKVVRDVINLPTLDSNYDAKTGIFTIKLYNFSAQSASLFRVALKSFVDSKSNRLIIDVRGNPGGYLDSAVDMASWFLPPGKTIVRESYSKGKPETSEKSRGYNIFNDNLRTVILVDQGSASASEILAGALQENGKAKLVGTRTFGKGSVQELVKLTPDTSLKVTIARWLTPNGRSISEGGLTPDVEVKVTADDVKKGTDPQMLKAIEILTN